MDTEDMPSSPQASTGSTQPVMVTPGDMLEDRIVIPEENDVLCGRGGSINSHKGNEQFRDLVEKRKRVYLTARFKREKRLIASSIVSEIRCMDPPGRFLARKGNKDQGHWYDIGDEKARDKTSQALRENAPSIRAEIETEINHQRAEMKRKETEEQAQKQPSSAYPPPPPSSSYYPPSQQQSYWDWYYHYYGYPPPHMPPHYPPHGAPAGAPPPPTGGHAPPPPGHPPHVHAPHPPSPQGYWGQPPPRVVPVPCAEKTGEEFKDGEDGLAVMGSHEEGDHRMAMDLQHKENTEAYEARKAQYKDSRATRSNAFVALGSNPRSQVDISHFKVAKMNHSAPFDTADVKTRLTQVERDHRLAVALQEKDDNALRTQLQASGDSSRRTSRSNAYSQATRASVMSSRDNNHSYGSLEQMVPASFVAWVTADTGLKPKSSAQRHVQFKEGERSTALPHPGSLQRQASVASVETRPLQPQAEQNPSLLSQVAHHILGSWETSAVAHDSKLPARETRPFLDSEGGEMETEGLEVQLRDAGNETSMPPPEPRVETDWPSKVGSCHTWIPETFGAAWGSTTHHALAESGQHGLSSMNSLEMDGSTNIDHTSVGGGSLTHLFDQDESLQRALREVPSWERSMGLSITSVEGDSASFIRVRDHKRSRPAPPPPMRHDSSGDMDWEGHPEQG